MAMREIIDDVALLARDIFKSQQGLGRLLEVVLNSVMQEEAATHVGAAMHERSADRRGYRNGTKPRRIKTRAGELELAVPQCFIFAS